MKATKQWHLPFCVFLQFVSVAFYMDDVDTQSNTTCGRGQAMIIDNSGHSRPQPIELLDKVLRGGLLPVGQANPNQRKVT